MHLENSIYLLKQYRENSLNHRYINPEKIVPLINNLGRKFKVNTVGFSVKNEAIYSITIGNGTTKILMWSQMHGNESTSTKSLFDVFNILKEDNWFSKTILENCTLTIIPILNPDGAESYTRLNANSIDLNRDAQLQSQPEIKTLFKVFEDLNPDFCFNLHGQRTIFSAGKTKNPATLSFLAPAQDVEASLTSTRKKAMEVIVQMNAMLQHLIPNQVGIYDDSFNVNCVGDTFQSKNVPTILFEAGHYANDYARDCVREFIGLSLIKALHYIVNTSISGNHYKSYFDIPLNEKLFYDIIIRNAKTKKDGENIDIAIQYQEVLNEKRIYFKPKIEKIGKLNRYFGHIEFDASSKLITTKQRESIYEGYENDFVLLNNELFALNLVNS